MGVDVAANERKMWDFWIAHLPELDGPTLREDIRFHRWVLGQAAAKGEDSPNVARYVEAAEAELARRS
jgi:hypothetical protein